MSDSNIPIFVSAAVVIVGAVITGAFSIWNQRGSARARREPTIPEIWDRMNTLETNLGVERRARIAVEDALRTVRAVFLDYVDRVQGGGSNALTDDERNTLEQTKEKI